MAVECTDASFIYKIIFLASGLVRKLTVSASAYEWDGVDSFGRSIKRVAAERILQVKTLLHATNRLRYSVSVWLENWFF